MTDISSEQRLRQWLAQDCELSLQQLEPLQQVISARVYYRAVTSDKSFIVTDAREAPEGIAQFPLTSQLLRQAGLYTPEVICSDMAQGLMLQEDLGSCHWYDQMQLPSSSSDYQLVLSELYKLQTFRVAHCGEALPMFDWQSYCQRASHGYAHYLSHVQAEPMTQQQTAALDNIVMTCADLLQQNEQVLCHRDFHSRNIMMLSEQKLAHIDFQMLCIGPVAYDLASILRDAYICLPESVMMQLLKWYFAKCHANEWLLDINWPEFLLWFDAATMLRHLRCIGLFQQLSRDPLYRQARINALNYIKQAIKREPLFADMQALLPQED